jgi:C4-dicarboxylate-specific signal transduction histidine kinase
MTQSRMHLRLGLLFYILAAVLAFPKWRVGAETTGLLRDKNLQKECREGPESVIAKFLSNKKASLQDFHIHGWRWHTMSLVREAERLSSMAQRFQTKPVEERHPLQQAADYVIGFNLKGLHKIEADLFFPWMKEKLTAIQERELSQAFATVMDELEKDRKTVAKLGDSIVSLTNQINQSLFSIMNTLLTKAFSSHSFRNRMPKWRAIQPRTSSPVRVRWKASCMSRLHSPGMLDP